MLIMKNDYKNYISLGYFCNVAIDLEKLGLRDQSSPFDWIWTYFEDVINAIDKEFDGFMDYDKLAQSVNARNHYQDGIYHFIYWHDFSMYYSLEKQYEAIKSKYDRRIHRFLQAIKEPTLFVRYIPTEDLDENNKAIDLNWIEDNYDRILSVIKRYNPENDIVFIGDETVKSDIIKVYNVNKDEGDIVSRLPIINNKELYPILSSAEFPGREENIERYLKKQKKNKSFCFRLKKETIAFFTRHFHKVYKHPKTFDIPGK